MSLSEAALKYIGVPFMHQGRTRRGLDCVGLLALSMRDCGYVVENIPSYGRQPADGKLRAALEPYGLVELDRPPAIDDVIVASLRPGGPAVHIGIVTAHPHGLGVVHTYGHIGKVVHQRLDDRKLALVRHVMEWRHGT